MRYERQDTSTPIELATNVAEEKCKKKVHVKHLFYKVPLTTQPLRSIECTSIRDEECKHILKDVSLTVKCGQMLAILGGSGSGKTTLLDVIANRHEGGFVEGEVLINNKMRNKEMMKDISAYVRQDDYLLPNLTVRETLLFVAELKLPSSYSRQKKLDRVTSVLSELGLRHVCNSKVGGEEVRGCSGGERRRVSIGVQMLMDPHILFLDEPTSGLDSFTAHHLIVTMSELAKSGRTVILTIHQPRSDIFELFDLMTILSDGHVVYAGQAKAMLDYFTLIGYPCPPLTNPCDFYIDLTTIDHRHKENEAVSRERMNKLLRLFQEATTDVPSGMYTSAKISLGSSVESESDSNSRHSQISQSLTDGDSGLGITFDEPPKGSDSKSLVRQFRILIVRAFKNELKGYSSLLIQAIEALFMSIMIGCIFINLGFDQISVRDRVGLFFIMGGLYPFIVILDTIAKFNAEREIFYREMEDGLYTTGPYFFSKVLSTLPFHTAFLVLYTVPMYWLAGLQPTIGKFLGNCLYTYMAVYSSRCMAMAISAAVTNFQAAAFVANLLFTVFLLSSGFIINLESLWLGVRWLKWTSYLKWSFQALNQIEFHGLRFSCNASMVQMYGECPIANGTVALKSYDLDKESLPECFSALLGIIVLFLVLSFVFLKFVNQKPKK
ncbi:ATP-binding cassette sub-family G member 8-like [Bolinopsis microptera]|uniref:ATP-binding cassette sub-family G member 8-like n=1 Tax=Bolinopsis microptera TaxID=2820187 RepID=UPI00307A599C